MSYVGGSKILAGILMRVTGRCHCGNISLSIDWPELSPAIQARACGCTFCRKHGAAWTSNPEALLAVEIEDPTAVSEYALGTETAIFHVCSRCGVPALVTSEIGNRLYAVVNVNVLEEIDPTQLERIKTDFGGEDLQSRLARRTRNWIANVQFGHQPRQTRRTEADLEMPCG